MDILTQKYSTLQLNTNRTNETSLVVGVASTSLARNPLSENNLNINGDLNTGDATSQDTNKLSNSFNSDINNSFTGNSNANNALDNGTEISSNIAFNPGSQGSNIGRSEDGDALNFGDASVQPEQNSSLELDGEGAASAQQPDSKLLNGLDFKSNGSLGASAEFENDLDISAQVELSGNPGFEGADVSNGQNAGNINSGINRNTHGAGDGGSGRNGSDSDGANANLSFEPEANSNLEIDGETAFGACEPGGNNSLNIGGKRAIQLEGKLQG
ncbi:hypothetical protein EYB25_009201 [Talaromyces marneffei]|nr:hypothetical protein EYB25_009201 [Talaromyces marneffei]